MEEKIKLTIEKLQKDIKSLRASQKKNALVLRETNKVDLKEGIMKNGKKYSVRSNRDRFFYPTEWFNFFDALKPQQRITFEILINTGARINEARHIKIGDIDFDRGNIILRVTKVKAKKGEKNSRPRTISISTQFTRKLKSYLKDNNLLDNEQYIGLLSNPAAHLAMKKALQKAGIKDWHMFSVHNIRKTHGNWLKSLGVDSGEICKRLGQDMNTFIKCYVSSDIFNFKDRQDMRLILGDVYQK